MLLVAESMWTLAPSWREFVLRAMIARIVLPVMLRTTGKRPVGQIASFDLVHLPILLGAILDAIDGGDNPALAELAVAGTRSD